VDTIVRRKFWTRLVLVLMLAAVVQGLALAQTSQLQGVLKDPQDKVVPGAEITLTSKSTSAERTTVTDDSGNYQFAQVSPGQYQVRAELAGFKTVVVDDLRLLVDTPMTLDLKFSSVGEVSETVVVSAERMLNKTDATVGNQFNELQIMQLPIESRNVVDLLKLQPGVTKEGYVAGARSDQSNLTLDGIDVNEQQTGEAFESVVRVTPDSVQEFRVTTINANANQGRSSGAQVSLVTKSGTNDFHGNLYEYHRNTVTTANDFFNNRVVEDPDRDGKPGIARPNLIRNLFGASLGGPISKDKLFFFFNYEGRKDRKQESQLRFVPLPHLGEGQVKYVNTAGEKVTLDTGQLNGLFPVGINPLAIAVLKDAAARYPMNDDGEGDGINTGGYRFNASMPLDWNIYTTRLDYIANDNHSIYARFNYQWDNQARQAQYYPDSVMPKSWYHPIGLSLSHSWTMSNTLLNNLRYGLTRQAYTSQGASDANRISFREVFEDSFTRKASRTTPVHNITDDLSWTKSNHTVQVGTNIRLIRNNRENYSRAYDEAIVNALYYSGSGSVVSRVLPDLASSSRRSFQMSAAALIGRYSQYQANYTYDLAGKLQPAGTPTERSFGTEEYEFYFQDSWRATPDFTLTYGVRWGVNTPVYETNGFQLKPDFSLGQVFEARKNMAARGEPYNPTLSLDYAGPYYDKKGWYDMEWGNLAPRVAFAWSPRFDSGILRAIFGGTGQTVIRGGAGMIYDRVGSALAVSFDLGNSIGYTSSEATSANTFNVSTKPGPLFTGFNQSVRTPDFTVVTVPENMLMQQPADERTRIEQSLDDSIQTPVNYTWNLSIGRELPGGLFIEGSYLGRAARNLLAQRDVMHLNNIVDPVSGMDWYTAARKLAEYRDAGISYEDAAPIPYFENLFPYAAGDGLTATQWFYYIPAPDGYDTPDWTWVQDSFDNTGIYPNMFFHPQYAALNVWSSVAYSDYHAFTLTARERFKDDLVMDFNYTWSNSWDNASGLQAEGAWSSSAFIVNPLYPDASYAASDFDANHVINANWLWYLPFGKGRRFGSGMNPVLNQVLGNWRFNGIYRWNTGLPVVYAPFTSGVWPTNWNLMTPGYRIRDPKPGSTKDPKPDADGNGRAPNLFADPDYAYQSYRNAIAGESGDRNVLRYPGYAAFDFGLSKVFDMPYGEGHQLEFRWEVFNATNTQRLGEDFAVSWLGIDPYKSEADANWFSHTNIQGSPRVMQFALRYDF